MSEPKWLSIARGYEGTKEVAGAKHNPTIVAFFKRVVGRTMSDETAWCAVFVGSCLAEAGETSSGKLNARSYLDWGQKLDAPRLGCVVVLSRGDPKGWQGHVAFYLGESGSSIVVLGGNQGNKVSIAKYARSRVLGYRWPEGRNLAAPLPKPRPDIRSVQRRLKELGYDPGNVDGVAGGRTRGAVLAFKADWTDRNPDRPLPLTDDLDEATLAALMRAEPRAIAPERAAATLSDLREDGCRTVAATDAIKAAGVTVAAAGGIAGAVEETGILDTVRQAGDIAGQVTEAVSPFRGLLEVLADYWWLLPLAVGGFVVWQAVKAARARLDDHRQGRTA